MKKIGVSLILAAMLLPANVFAAKTLKLAHFQTADLSSPKHAASLAFKQYVESTTEGSLKVDVYPASQLGNGNTVMEGLELGSIQMGIVHDGAVGGYYKPFNVFAIPYLFSNHSEAWKVVDGPFLELMSKDMVKKNNIKLLAMADNGIRCFTNSKRQIKSPADMKGLKIRVMTSPIYIDLVKSLGASPQAIPWPELPTALQQKVVDGQENGVTNIVNASMYQTQKYFTADGHVFSWHAYMMNASFFNKLSDKEKEAVLDGISLAKTIHRGMTAAQDANAKTILTEKGMEVYNPTPAELAEFRKLAQPAGRKWVVEEIGEEWVAKLEGAIKATQ
ncbi:MAG: DctP family TRAP transporter solute-binding subunit [Desulfocapsaceae bacterium]|nr:DctP family TRAP transporter solute-binding subunit [Desulfocapsaceae bacterium]